jgi:RimJ/RimL family protein N-acetyltransferase
MDLVPFPPMPLRLETERLVLAPETAEDAGWLAALFTARGAGPVSVEEARERVAAMEDVVSRLGIGVRVLRTRDTGGPLGYCGIVVGRGSVAEPELAYELLPAAQGQGYATEAARAVLDAAFATGRRRIWATVRRWNAPSFRVLEKLGFRPDHVTTDDDGDVVWMLAER